LPNKDHRIIVYCLPVLKRPFYEQSNSTEKHQKDFYDGVACLK